MPAIPFRVPPDHLLPERLRSVLAVLYLVFSEGYSTSAGEEHVRADLCEEAIRLAKLLVLLMPDEPEALGLLALMLLQDARRDARRAPDGSLVLLEDQDRSRWNRRRIDEGQRVLERALAHRAPGPYQLQAAIAALHVEAEHRTTRTGHRSPRSTPSSRAASRRRSSSSTARSPSRWPKVRSAGSR